MSLELQSGSHIQAEHTMCVRTFWFWVLMDCDKQHTESEANAAGVCMRTREVECLHLHKNIIIALIVFPFDVDGFEVRALANYNFKKTDWNNDLTEDKPEKSDAHTLCK